MKIETKKQIKKDFGEVFFEVEDILKKKTHIIPTTPKLDLALGGGIPEGSWVIISGKEKSGKSVMCLTLAAKAQKPEYGGKKVYYFDIENRLKKMTLEGVPGLDLSEDKFQIIRSNKDNIITAEKYLEIAESILKMEPNVLVILDSASALCSEKEYNDEISSQGRNSGPKLLATFTRKLAPVVPVNDSIVIIIQHMIANTSGYGSPFLEDGGNKIKYQCDVKIRAKGYSKWSDGKDDKQQIGQVVNWDVVHSALGAPGQSVETYLRFGQGYDDVWELITIAMDLGLIEKAGSWLNLAFLDTPEKIQGQQKVWDRLKANPKEMKLLEAKIKKFYEG